MKKSSSIWDKRYAPKKLKDFVIIDRLRKKFQKIIDNKDVKMIRLLYGGPGHGKTTLAEIVAREIGAQWKIANVSDNRQIDYVRDVIAPFAQSASMVSGVKKIFILDEADQQTHDAKKMMKKLVVDTLDNCSYIITTNHVEAFDEANLSRVDKISLIPQNEKEVTELQKGYFMRCVHILKSEKVKYDPKVLKKFVKQLYPDIRQMIMSLQDCYDSYGEINDNILEVRASISGKLLGALQNGVTRNDMIEISNEVDPTDFFYSFHNKIAAYLTGESLVNAYAIYGFYNATHNNAINKKASLACCLIELGEAKLKFKS